MSLLDDLKTAKPKGAEQTLCIIARLDSKDRDGVLTARERGVSLQALSNILNSNGHKTSATAMGRHFSGSCNCGR